MRCQGISPVLIWGLCKCWVSLALFFRWKLRLSANLVTLSAGDLSVTLCEFSRFLCKLEKLSAQIKLEDLRYSRILHGEHNGKPIDYVSSPTPPLILLLSCMSCKKKCQGVPMFSQHPGDYSGILVVLSVFWCMVCESLVWFPSFSLVITECRQLIREPLVLSQRWQLNLSDIKISAISLCVLLPPRGLLKIIYELRILQTAQLRTDVE